MTLLPVDDGLAFDEILEYGDSTALFASLFVDTLDKINHELKDGVDSEINKLFANLLSCPDADQGKYADAICDKLNEYTTLLDNQVNSDLQAQLDTKQQLDNLNIAATLMPPEDTAVPTLIDLIATDAFKQIFVVPVDSTDDSA